MAMVCCGSLDSQEVTATADDLKWLEVKSDHSQCQLLPLTKARDISAGTGAGAGQALALASLPARGVPGSLQGGGQDQGCVQSPCSHRKMFWFKHGIIVLPSKPTMKAAQECPAGGGGFDAAGRPGPSLPL